MSTPSPKATPETSEGLQDLNIITLRHLLPAVFAPERELHDHGHVWQLPEVTFRRGEYWLIHSASGRGKSSLCAYIYGLRTDYLGEIIFNGRDIRTLSPGEWNRLHRHSLAYLPQEMRLFPELTALENIQLKNRLTHFKSEAQLRQMLQAVEMEGYSSRRCGLLSLGQQQRVAAVRALCQPFQFLLLDEPVSHLDPQANLAIAALIKAEATAQQAGVIVTSVGADLALDGLNTLQL